MKRRDFIKKSAVAGAGVVAASTAFSTPAISQGLKDGRCFNLAT